MIDRPITNADALHTAIDRLCYRAGARVAADGTVTFLSNHEECGDLREMRDENAIMGKPEAQELADYILQWLRNRNGEELSDALDAMRVIDARNMREELVHILKSGGKPPNWVR